MTTPYRTVLRSVFLTAILLGITAATALAAPPAQSPDGIYHTVRWGETLTSIAQRYGTTVDAIVRANNIRNPSYVHAGVRLLIPTASQPETAPPQLTATVTYTVRRGDNLTAIATRYGTTVEAIAQANDIRNPSMIYVGMALSIPAAPSPEQAAPRVSDPTPQPFAASQTVAEPSPTPLPPAPSPVQVAAAAEGPVFYTVRWGDTLTSIAYRFGTTVEAISRANNIWNPSFIHAGARLRIPGASQPAIQEAQVSLPAASSPTATPVPPPPVTSAPPVAPPAQLPTPVPAAVPAIALCNPQISITYPPINAILDGWGMTWIRGTANIDGFQFYKLEYGIGEVPIEWHSIGDVSTRPIVNGILGTWNTGALPDGVYHLRLVVVDNRGQYPPPCQVRIVVDHTAATAAPPSPLPPSAPLVPLIATPVPSSADAPALCNPQISLTYPRVNTRLNGWGTTWIRGTAQIPDFQFYKLEYGIGERPFEWYSIGEVYTKPIVNGILGTWNTGALPPGVYQLRLVVVDNRGQYPPPCQVRMVIDHTAEAPAAPPLVVAAAPSPVPAPTPTPVPAAAIPALCNPRVSIAYPTVNAVLDGWGTTWIKGTADIPDFQFYKLEYGIGETPFQWFGIGDVERKRIVNGILGTWNTGALPPGVYQLRLVAVDNTGNFPPPCQVRVIVSH